jgi:ribose transport system substrate-binding protein
MKRIISTALTVIMLLTFGMLTACTSNSGTQNTGNTGANTSTEQPKNHKDEVYVWACQYNSLPLFVNNDYIGMDVVAEELGVTVKKVGPQKIDLPAFVAAIEQEIVKKPAGMMVVGWDPSLQVGIDKAMDAGIPVVTVDADVPASKRLCFVGTNWYDLGVEQAKAVAPFLKDKTGKAAIIGLPAADNTTDAKNGYIETLKKLAPGITVIDQVYDSQSNPSKVAEAAANLISSNPDLLAIAGTDSAGGPGIATAIKEANKVGQIFGTCVDAEAEHLQGVKDGALVAAVGQKRHFFTYYGVKMLYDYNHSKIQFTKDDRKAGISNIPSNISTGFIVANKDNVDLLIEAQANKAK